MKTKKPKVKKPAVKGKGKFPAFLKKTDKETMPYKKGGKVKGKC